MGKNNTKKLVSASLFAALTCVFTLIIQIPSPMNGYINLGDGLVLMSAWLLGPVYGAAAAGVGSMLADLFTGFAIYAPGTFIIKGLAAVTACCVFRALGSGKLRFVKMAVAGAAGECVMAAGYFGYAALILGNGLAALSSVPGNLIQGAVGVVVSVSMMSLLSRGGGIPAWTGKDRKGIETNV